MPSSPAQQLRRAKRLRAVEQLYLNGYSALEIYDILRPAYKISRGGIRNDIVVIRKAWGEDLNSLTVLEGRERYLASVRALRHLAMEGRDAQGREFARDAKFAHQLDKEIARLSGVKLASDEHTIHVDIQQARDFMDQVLEVVFRHVTDAGVQEAIVAELELLGEGDR